MTAGAAPTGDLGHFLYFAYGSNLSEERLHERCPSARLETTARLPDYRLAFTRRSERWGGGVADIRPDGGAEVWGAVWRVPSGEGAALDAQEGVHASPPRYRRLEVRVATPAGKTLACLAYQVVEPEAEHVPPSEAYLATLLRGARACSLASSYVEQIEALGRA